MAVTIAITIAIAIRETDPAGIEFAEQAADHPCPGEVKPLQSALDHAALCTGADTAMFFVALDEAGAMLGGVRAKGPLRCADDSHAVAEWQGQAGQNAVRKMITDRYGSAPEISFFETPVIVDNAVGKTILDAAE